MPSARGAVEFAPQIGRIGRQRHRLGVPALGLAGHLSMARLVEEQLNPAFQVAPRVSNESQYPWTTPAVVAPAAVHS